MASSRFWRSKKEFARRDGIIREFSGTLTVWDYGGTAADNEVGYRAFSSDGVLKW